MRNPVRIFVTFVILFQEAIKDFDRAIKLNPYLAKAYSQRRFIRIFLADGTGEQDLRRAARLDLTSNLLRNSMKRFFLKVPI